LSAEAEGRPFKLSDEVIAKAPQVAEDERRCTTNASGDWPANNAPSRTTAAENPGTGGVSLQARSVQLQPGAAAARDEHVVATGGHRRGVAGGNPAPQTQRGGDSRLAERHHPGDPRAESAINEIKSKIDESEQTFRSEAAKELNQKRTDLSKITASSIAIDDRVSRTTVSRRCTASIKRSRSTPSAAWSSRAATWWKSCRWKTTC
jgi:adhesin transport system membrane fusion protein